MIGLYTFILCVAGLVGYSIYGIYCYIQKQSATQEKDSKFMNDILRLVHDQAMAGKKNVIIHNKVSKVYLMEQTNLPPKVLKQYLSRLQHKGLIRETADTATITPFGIQFYETFSNDKLNIGS